MNQFYTIPNYDGYEIDKEGNVRSTKYKTIILKPSLSRGGYKQVVLSQNGNRTAYFIHTLMAITFLNHTKENGLIIDHINNNKLDNRLDNLQLVSYGTNKSKDAVNNYTPLQGVSYIKKGKKHWRAQITKQGVYKYLGIFNTPEEAHQRYLQEVER